MGVLAFSFWGPVKSWVWGFWFSAFVVLEEAGFGVFGFHLLRSCQTPGLGGLSFNFWDPGGSWVLGFEVSGFGILDEAGFGGLGFQLLVSWRKLVLGGSAFSFWGPGGSWVLGVLGFKIQDLGGCVPSTPGSMESHFACARSFRRLSLGWIS